jgi:hypothetical protein
VSFNGKLEKIKLEKKLGKNIERNFIGNKIKK